MSYSYRIDNYSSTISVLPAEGGKSTVEWRGAATGTVAASVEVGASPSGVALTPDGALIVTADRDDIDVKTFARKGTVKVNAHPFGVAIDPQSARQYG